MQDSKKKKRKNIQELLKSVVQIFFTNKLKDRTLQEHFLMVIGKDKSNLSKGQPCDTAGLAVTWDASTPIKYW